MKKYKELAILFKKVIDRNNEIEFIPVNVVEGTYNEEHNCFIDKDGTPYYHIIENPDSYGFCYHDSIINYKKDHHLLTLPLIKTLILSTIKKYIFSYNIDSETEAPVIIIGKKNTKAEILVNEEIKKFYEENFPNFYNKYLSEEENLEEKQEENLEDPEEELNIQKIYNILTEHVIDQEEAIKIILRAIWKQTSKEESKAKNILIEGNSGVGKSKIFKILSEKTNIPIVTISANDYIFSHNNSNMEYIILELLRKANGNIEMAQKGIVIIDKFEELLVDKLAPDTLDELEKLFEGKILTINSDSGSFKFDTSNLMIIGLSNQNNRTKRKIIGFDYEGKNNTNKVLVEKFATIIKMNNLDHNSFVKILKSKNGLLSSNIEFLSGKGVSLKIEEPAIIEMAHEATKGVQGVRSLDEIIERTLSVAEFEIASNPNIYSELIITRETTEDNKAYTLVRRKTNTKKVDDQ